MQWLLGAAGAAGVAVNAEPVAQPAEPEAARVAFMAAMQRVRLHQPDGVDGPELKNYAIYSYVVAARLRRDLNSQPNEALDAAIDGFLQEHGSLPVTRALRREWLISLAERKRWDLYLTHSLDSTEPALVCARFEARLATGDTVGLADAVLARWSLPQKQPQCAPAFAWLRQQGVITPALTEGRTRAALLADDPHLARAFAVDLPPARAAELLRWADLLETPKSALNVLATHPASPIEADALGAGFDKLARNDPVTAINLLPLLLARKDTTPALAARLQRGAALGAAYAHDSQALALFDALPADIDPQVQEWRVRSALWFGDYTRALAWIAQMNPPLASQPRWRYWRARAVAATTGEAGAVELYGQISGLRDYYGYLAADRLQTNYSLNMRASPYDAAEQTTLAAHPGLIRAHELFDCNLTDDAGAEWSTEMTGLSPPVEGPGGPTGRALGLVLAIDRYAGPDRRIRRCEIALSAAVPRHCARCRRALAGAAGLDIVGHASRESVSQGRRVARQCARSHADAARHRLGRRPALAVGAAGSRRPVRSCGGGTARGGVPA